MNGATRKIGVAGPVGNIEVALDAPAERPRGLAIIAHPHPLFGGTLDNKVAQTLARAFIALGYLAARPNFRGVGGTAGVHDEGRGEVDDLVAVRAALTAEEGLDEVVLAGFSFGGFVQSLVAERLTQLSIPPHRMVLVAPAVTRSIAARVPENTLVIHGELDETVPLKAVLDWSRPQGLPIVVVPDADHFFHHKLTLLKRLVMGAWLGERLEPQHVGAESS